MAKIAILGTGAWGTALANVLLKKKHKVYMWGIDEKEISDLKKGLNTKYFGNRKLVRSPTLVTKNMNAIEDEKPNFVLLAVPSSVIESTVESYLSLSKVQPIIINVAKGFDKKTNDVWSKTIKRISKKRISGFTTLIGPSFANEVFDNQPTIVNCVSKVVKTAKKVSRLFNSPTFKCVEIKDEIGAEIMSALKNVIAIALGLAYAQHTSINTRAAMLAQATKEIAIVVKKMGGKTRTITQFCGIGDIYLTCTDTKSRNYSFGAEIAKLGAKAAINKKTNTVEGYFAAETASNIIKKLKIKAPVLTSIYNILYMGADEKNFVRNIMNQIL